MYTYFFFLRLTITTALIAGAIHMTLQRKDCWHLEGVCMWE